jgi:subfamily B ATP-binding cassette protein MsbA
MTRRLSSASLRWLYRVSVRPMRGTLTLLVITTLTANVVMLAQPIILAAMLAALLGPSAPTGAAPVDAPALDLSYLGGRVLAWLGAASLRDLKSVPMLGAMFHLQVNVARLLAYLASMIAHRIKVRGISLLQQELADHLLSLSLRFFHTERSGELHSRFMQDVRSTAQGIGPLVQSVINDVTQIILLSVFLLSTSVWLTTGAVVLMAVHFGITGVMKNPTRRLGRLGFDAWASLSTVLQEALVNIRVTKSFAAERFERRKLGVAIQEVVDANWRYGFLEKAEAPLRSIVDAAAILGILLIAVVQMRTGALTTQGVLLYLFVGRMLIAPISHVATNALVAQTLLASYDRVHELLARRADLRIGTITATALEREIALEHVSFAYNQVPALRDVSLTIRRGEMVALVGPSGAGKSTLVDLILRLYHPDAGAIRLDGTDIRELAAESYLRLFGVVPQESQLFNDTIRNNIRFGREALTDDDVVRAARIANADGFITATPGGYDTVVGDRGVRLSGGERQRIAIARAVAHRPKVLVLDEATSSLDSESEAHVQRAIDDVTRDTTAIVIAHRLSTVVHADRIVVLERGGVVDVGRHHELLDRCELYRALCARQFDAQPAVAEPLS